MLKQQLIKQFQIEKPQKQVKEKVNKTISELLKVTNFQLTADSIFQLAPYFLQNGIVNLLALSIGEFLDPNDLLLPFMPFHETQMFTQLAQRCNYDGPHFLSSLKAPLQRKTLSKIMTKDPTLLGKIFGHVLKTVEKNIYYPQLSSFYLSTMLEILNHAQDPTTIRIILANVFQIAQHDIHIDFKATILIILTHIAQRIDLKDEIFLNIQMVMEHFLTAEVLEMTLLTCLSMYQNQPNLPFISDSLIKCFCNMSGFSQNLLKLIEQYSSDTFANAVVIPLTEAMFTHPACRSVYSDILRSNFIGESLAALMCQKLLDEWLTYFIVHGQKIESESEWIAEITSHFQNKYSTLFSTTIESKLKFIDGQSSDIRTKNAFHKMFNLNFKGTVFQKCNGTVLFLALHHADDMTRFNAIGSLERLLTNEDHDHASMIIERLNDSYPKVVSRLLKLKNLELNMDVNVLADRCLSILKESEMDQDLRIHALTKLVAISSQVNTRLLADLQEFMFGFLFCTLSCRKMYAYIIQEARTLLGLSAWDSSAIIKSFTYIDSMKVERIVEMNNLVVSEISETLVDPLVSQMVICMLTSKFPRTCFVAALILSQFLSIHRLKNDLESPLIESLIIHLSSFSVEGNIQKKQIMHQLVKSKDVDGGIREVGYIYYHYLTLNLIKSVPKQQIQWNQTSPYVSFLQRAFVGICQCSGHTSSIELLKLFIETHLSSNTLQFLVLSWKTDSPPFVLCTTLNICQQLLIHNTNSENDFQVIIPYLLPFLSHYSKEVREGTVQVLEVLHKCYVSLPSKIYGREQLTDMQFLPASMTRDFLADLLSRKIEFIIDRALFKSWLNEYFDSKSLKPTKENSALLFLLNHLRLAIGETQVKLLSLLVDVPAVLKVVTLLPVALAKLGDLDNVWSKKFVNVFFGCLKNFTSKHVGGDEMHSFAMQVFKLEKYPEIVARFIENFPIKFCQATISTKKQSKLLMECVRLSFIKETCSASKKLIQSMEFSPKVFIEAFKTTGYLNESHQNPNIKNLIFISETLVKRNEPDLAGCFFQLLNNLMNKTHPSSEYAKQIILTNLHNVVHTQISEDVLRVDTLVQVLRTSPNPSTQTLVLLVLSEIAQWNAHIVITNILPIFTFMGTMLRQDDEYTYHVISKTLQILLPNLSGQVDDVIDIFVEAVNHIPKHRRVKVFQLLVKGTSLPKILAKLVEKKEEASLIATQLALKYEISEVLIAIEDMVQVDFLSWIDSLLGNKIFKGVNDREVVEGIMEKVFESAYGIIGKLNAMLETAQFIEMCSNLMKHKDVLIRNNALTLFAEKAGHADMSSQEVYTSSLFDLVHIIENDSNVESKQHALLCVSVLIKQFGKLAIDLYIPLFDLGCRIMNDEKVNENVHISCLAMISLLTVAAGPRCLPTLSKIIPTVFQRFNSTTDMQLLGCVGYLHSIIDIIPQFLSPYINTILEKLFDEKIISLNKSSRPMAQKVFDKNMSTLSLLGKVPTRVLLPALYSFYSHDKPTVTLLSYFGIVEKIISDLPRTEISDNNLKLHAFFLNVLQHEIHKDDRMVEEKMYKAYSVYVLKLNESLFKTHFLKMIDWATEDKLVPFYRTVRHLFDTLKSLFSPYYNYVLDKSISGLDNSSIRKDVLDSLYSWILHRGDMEISEQIQKVLKPIAQQIYLIENDSTQYQESVDHVVPCLVQICVSSSEPVWKQVNTHIHAFAQSQNADIRMIALIILKQIYEKLGEEYLVLLPETIPFLAELMEDEDEKIEKMCHQVCAVIQQYLGEDIQQYFNA